MDYRNSADQAAPPSSPPGTLGNILERHRAVTSDLRRLYEMVTQLDVSISGHHIPPEGNKTSAPTPVRSGFIELADEQLNEMSGLVAGIEVRLRNLGEKIG